MEYSALLKRSWEIVWNNKWLILLGMLVALGSGSGGSGGRGNSNHDPANDNFESRAEDFPQALEQLDAEAIAAIIAVGAVALVIAGVVIVLAILFWGITRVATGGLIAGVDQLETSGASSFSQAWRVGWSRGWPLIGIGLVNMLPGIIFVLGILSIVMPRLSGLRTEEEIERALRASSDLIIPLVALGVLAGLFTIVLGILRGLADRAAVLEGTGVFASYGRAWTVVNDNLGQAVIVALLHILVQLGLNFVFFVPGLFMTALACIFWPILLAFGGTVEAYFSTMWTLAWRQWTARPAAARPLTGPAADISTPRPAV